MSGGFFSTGRGELLMNDRPKPQKTYKTHTFVNGLEWTGGDSWKILNKSCHEIKGGPPLAFGGSDENWSPEDLLLASVNTCHISSFIGYTKRKRFEFISYTSEIEGLLEYDSGKFRYTKMVIRPKLVVKSEEDIETARAYINRAHDLCFMGHSVNAEVTVEPEITASEDNSNVE